MGTKYGNVIRGRQNALESTLLEGAKKILGCSSKTCNEAVRKEYSEAIFV